MNNLRGRHLVSLADWSREDIKSVLELAANMKINYYAGIRHQVLAGKTLAMIFSKPSTRTRVSFEVAMTHLGGHALYLGASDLQLGRGETISDTAQVVSRYCDAIMIRTFSQDDVVDLANHSRVPVINGLTDFVHPVQILADLLTIKEKLGRLEGIKIAFVGDGNNVAHSLLLGGAKFGMEVRVVCAEGYEPDKTIVQKAEKSASVSHGKVVVTNDVEEGVRDVDVVYSDVWISMNQEKEREERLRRLKPYRVDENLMERAGKDSIFMHCLPAHRGEEVTADVADGSKSVIFDEAENRLHVEKALLALVM